MAVKTVKAAAKPGEAAVKTLHGAKRQQMESVEVAVKTFPAAAFTLMDI